MCDDNVVAVLPPEWLNPFSMEDRMAMFKPRLQLEKIKLEPEPLVWMPPVDMPPLRRGPLCSVSMNLDDEYSVAPRRTNAEILAAMKEPTIEIGGESFAITCRPSWLDPSDFIERVNAHDADRHRLLRMPKSNIANAIEQMAKEKGWR